MVAPTVLQAASAGRRPASRGSPPSSDRTCRRRSRSTARRSSVARCRRAVPKGRESGDSPDWRFRRSERIERGGHSRRVRVQVERRAVGEERAPLRVERNQLELILQVPPRLREDPPRTDGMRRMVGPMSKRKPALREHGGLAAEPRVLLEENDVVAARPPACRPRPGRRDRRRSHRSDLTWFLPSCLFYIPIGHHNCPLSSEGNCLKPCLL